MVLPPPPPVIEVVPPDIKPTKYQTIGRRKKISYVVEAQPVGPGYGKRPHRLGKPRVYWPVASALLSWSGGTSSPAMRVAR